MTGLYSLLFSILLAFHSSLADENCSLAVGRISPSGLVDTDLGRVQGSLVKHANGNVFQFLSLPYAEKPIGRLRFSNPVSFRSPWNDTRSATTLPSLCTQADASGQLLNTSSEDCLYLNLWIPETVNHACDPLPVMMFIHGGSFNFGTASEQLVNASMLSSQADVIVATINYRLGFLGFLTGSGNEGINQGLRDQEMAIHWLHQNIADFGGDKKRITIFGHSAGAISVGIHMLNQQLPIAGGIMQSGHPYSFLRPDSVEVGREKSLKFSKHFNCSSTRDHSLTPDALDCLRSIDEAQLITYGGKQRMHSTILPNPVYGDSLLPETAARYMRSPELNSLKPLLIGFNQDEGENFVARNNLGKPETYSQAKEQLKILFANKLLDSQVDKVADAYINASMNSDDLQERIYDAYGDLYVYCGILFYTKAYEGKKKGDNGIFMYNLRHKSSVPVSPIALCKGVCHGEELPLVFASPLKDPSHHTSADINVSKYVIAKWSQFVRQARVEGWKEWTSDDVSYNEINSEPRDLQFNSDKLSQCESVWRPIFNENGS